MNRVDTFMDWICILISPLIAIEVWSTQDMQFLRFLAAIWFVGTLLEALRDRYRAAVAATKDGERA